MDRLTGNDEMQFTRTFGYPDEVIAARFWAKVRKSDGCWEWTGMKIGKNSKYGTMKVKPRAPWAFMMAHRLSYTLTHGEVPTGMEVDHLCCNTLCVRPDHLEAVTHEENLRRSFTRNATASCLRCQAAINPRFTFCRECWMSIPAENKTAISAAFEVGKSITGQTSPAYWDAVNEAASK